jgi:hypothetical protein
MASPARIREALEKLFGAKKANEEVRGTVSNLDQGQSLPVPLTSDSIPDASSNLRQARQQAQEVQGQDPLRKMFRPGDDGSLTDLGEAGNQVMARRGAGFRAEQPESHLDAMFMDFVNTKGREPTPEEMLDIMRREEVITTPRPVNPADSAPINSNELLDEIPF